MPSVQMRGFIVRDLPSRAPQQVIRVDGGMRAFHRSSCGAGRRFRPPPTNSSVRLLRAAERVEMSYTIRKMVQSDVDAIADTFLSWNKKREQYERYYEENRCGLRVTLVAVMGGELIGYANVLWESGYEPFRRGDIPEINDLNVIEEHQNRGIGRALIREAERIIAATGKSVVGIGVGQTPDYAAAQHLYPKLGYVLDGRGISPTKYGDVAYLTKVL